MADKNSFVREQVQQDGLDVFESRLHVVHVSFGDTSETSVVIENRIDRSDSSLVNNFAFGRDDCYAQHFAALGRVAHFAIQRVDAVIAIVRRCFRSRADKPPEVIQIFADMPFIFRAALGIRVAITARIGCLEPTTLIRPTPMVETGVVPE